MSTESSDLSTLARSKLHLSVGGKDNCSLHRWVLLKNSIVRSSSSSPTTPTTPLDKSPINHVYSSDEGSNEDEEVCCDEETDSFMFPDASKLNSCGEAGVTSSEAEWLDSLLETLGDDDDFTADSDVHVSILPVDDDDDDPSYSPLMSPMSSSDDLVAQPPYYPPPIAVPYPVPYPPFHPPLIRSLELDSLSSPLDSSPPPYVDALPYYDMDDVEDLAVPDAIEDTSDDESDAVSTPSLVRSSSNSLVDPASIPLPAERRRRPQLHVYIDTDDSYFYPFELDPLPFHEDRHNSYNHVYQEC